MLAGARIDPDLWSLGRLDNADAVEPRAALALALTTKERPMSTAENKTKDTLAESQVEMSEAVTVTAAIAKAWPSFLKAYRETGRPTPFESVAAVFASTLFDTMDVCRRPEQTVEQTLRDMRGIMLSTVESFCDVIRTDPRNISHTAASGAVQ